MVGHNHGKNHNDHAAENTLPQENNGNDTLANGDCGVSTVSRVAQGSDCWECGVGGEVGDGSTRHNAVAEGVPLHCQSLSMIHPLHRIVGKGHGWEHDYLVLVGVRGAARGATSSASWKSGQNQTRTL